MSRPVLALVMAVVMAVLALATTSCQSTSTGDETAEPVAAPPVTTPLTATTEPVITASTAGDPAPTDAGAPTDSPASPAPDWLGQRPLPTTPGGDVVVPQTTPAELVDRRLATLDRLAPPSGTGFESTVGPVEAEVLARSTWVDGCPVGPEELAYVTVSFWGFDGRPHTGELILGREVAVDLVEVFERLYDARFPIEEMRITSLAELDAEPTGDGNNTSAFVCRPVTGGSSFSEHAFGLAIDINPFLNPYERGDLVLPELAGAYLDRSRQRPGMIGAGDEVVDAFASIGWGWGGDWTSLKDYQHFSASGR